MVVSLLLLLIMTVLALSASQATRMQERMAGNSRDHDLALQSAEAGLRAGERMIVSLASSPNPCTAPPCQIYESGSPQNLGTGPIALRDDNWWKVNAWQYTGGDTMKVAGMARQDPTYLIENLEDVQEVPSIGPSGAPIFITHFRVTSRGVGGSPNSAVVLQTTWARKFN